MRTECFISFRLFLIIFCASLVLVGCTTRTVVGDVAPLRILLTNDDGYDAPGIEAVRSALLEAGHEVTLVAPLRDQSSSGARVTTRGTLDYKEQSPGVWSVDGWPADAVLVGLLHVMRDEPPDLVVSGANFGQNPGYAINSGTVGAATVAMYAGFPAMAVSVAVDYSEAGTTPYPFPSTLKAFPGAAGFVVDLIVGLQKTRTDNDSLLPAHTILNINYPALDPGEIGGVRVLRAARTSGVRFNYEETGDAGQLRIGIQPLAADEAGNEDEDLQMLALGFVTISVLDGDWDAGGPLRADITSRLSTLGQH